MRNGPQSSHCKIADVCDQTHLLSSSLLQVYCAIALNGKVASCNLGQCRTRPLLSAASAVVAATCDLGLKGERDRRPLRPSSPCSSNVKMTSLRLTKTSKIRSYLQTFFSGISGLGCCLEMCRSTHRAGSLELFGGNLVPKNPRIIL